MQRILRHSKPHVTRERYIKVFDRTVLEAVQGAYTIKLILGIAKNGTVTSVEAQGAPTPEIKSRVEQQTQQWIFEPYLKDGAPVNVNVNVIKAR